MTTEDVTRQIWRNTASNYVYAILRMGLGVLLFRMLWQGLSPEEFGFWALMWSVFGFGILLDFGFGFAAVKRVAELSVHQKWDELSRVLSTIVFLYVIIGLVMVALLLVGTGFMVGLFNITPENEERFRQIMIVFFIGMGLGFPLGVFPEILSGQQRLWLANVLFCIGLVANFVLVALGLHLEWKLQTLFLVALSSGILPCLLSAFFALQKMPHVKIRPGLFSLGMVRETLRFSLYAYVNTVSNILQGKTDHLVISSALAVSAVAVYQAGAKIAEMFSLLVQQLPDTFSPAAAHFNAKKDKTYLRQLLVNGTRLSILIATPLYLVCAFYMDGLLVLLTGDTALHRETYWVGQVLLLWGYISLVTQSVGKRIFMMCGHERRLMRLSVAETALNLVLSVGLVLYFRNVLGVALGSLISGFIFGWFYMWPWAAREAGIGPWALARTVLGPAWLACLPLLGFAVIGRFFPWFDLEEHLFLFMLHGGMALLIGMGCLWQYALTAAERELLSMKVMSLFARTRSTTT
jgi:O-antigen/teichoic acid export membrane protein